MKTSTRFPVASLVLALALVAASFNVQARAAFVVSTFADDATAQEQQQQVNALQRGYRTGYSDGFQSGWSDRVQQRARDYQGKADYQRADRVYIAAYGPLEDYQDGYRQGFEAGYDAGFERRGFDSTVPDTLTRRGTATTTAAATTTTAARRDDIDDDANSSTSTSGKRRRSDDYDNTSSRTDDMDDGISQTGASQTGAGRRTSGGVPAGTTLRVELVNRLSSDISQRGDPVEARVLEPREYEGAFVSGRVTSARRAGKLKGTAELQLNFEQIRLPGGRFEDISAQVVEVVRAGEESNVGNVDAEGGVRGRDSTKDDVAKIGASAGIGAIIGAIAGGGKGAGIGAIIGGAVGTGGVMTQRGKDIRLERGQQLMIRVSR
ncbi:MAG TPA: hypothetical protein VNA19_03775 [Pyrinomonadaceae bacterium]|jgi:type IV secretion system protein VirB10|nr:hypothetical protein [Pyrinomonadaceae bacterium]